MVTLKKISVLIIFYNEERTIKKTLDSIFVTDYPKNLIEVVCVDDGSTDKSALIAKKYPVKLLQQRNSGLSKSYNNGLSMCTGNYVLKLDAHMYLKNKNTFKYINHYLSSNKKLAGICGTYSSLQNNDRNFLRDIRRCTVFQKNDKERLITLNNFTTWSSAIGAFKRKFFTKNIFPDNFANSYGEDVFVQILLHNQGYSFLYTPKIKGVHDAQINNSILIKKMMLEIKATGNILLKASNKRNLTIPYLNFFLSYPLIFLLMLAGLIISPKTMLIPFILSLILEIFPSLKVFCIKKYSFVKRLLTFLYLLIKEFIQMIYLPYYYLREVKNAQHIVFLFKTLLYWEFCKFKNVSRLF